MDNHKPIYDLSPEAKKIRDGKRQAQVLRWRIWQGIKTLVSHPWKLVFVVLLVAAFLLCWYYRDMLLARIPLDIATLPTAMVQVFAYAFYILIILVFLLLLSLAFYVLGTPSKARKIDKDLPVRFRHDAEYGSWPIYLSCRRQGALYKYEFLSQYVKLEDWENRRGDIASLLGGYIDSIEYGGKEQNDLHRIVVYAGEGARPKVNESPTDPLFGK